MDSDMKNFKKQIEEETKRSLKLLVLVRKLDWNMIHEAVLDRGNLNAGIIIKEIQLLKEEKI